MRNDRNLQHLDCVREVRTEIGLRPGVGAGDVAGNVAWSVPGVSRVENRPMVA